MAGKYLSLLVHFTWSTARREPLIETGMREDLYSYIGGIMRNRNARLLAVGGMFDHIHLYASLRQRLALRISSMSLNPIRRDGFMNRVHNFETSLGKRVMVLSV